MPAVPWNYGRAMKATAPLIELLQALSFGNGSHQLWERGAATRYESTVAEAARVQLVRASIEAGEWRWPVVPPALAKMAKSLLEEILVRDQHLSTREAKRSTFDD